MDDPRETPRPDTPHTGAPSEAPADVPPSDSVIDDADGSVTDEAGDLVTDEAGDLVTDEAGDLVTDEAGDLVTDDAGDLVTDDAGDPATDAAVARVRAADPAAGATPDAPRLHVRLTEATGVALGAGGGTAAHGGAPGPAPTAPGTDAPTPATPTDELAAARARRGGPARWLQVAAVVAGVAIVGTGGYAVGASGADQPAAPPIALQGAGGAGAPEMAADAMSSRIAPGWWGGRTVFSGSGLDGAAGSARAWAFDASQAATARTAAHVAQVLGVPGEPRLEWGQWTVGTNDGLSATVQVGVDGQATMWFYDRAWDPSVCAAGIPQTLDGGGTSGAATSRLADPAAAAEPAGPGAVDPGAVDPGVADPGTAEPATDPTLEPVPAPDIAPLPAPDLQEPAPADPSVCDPASTPTGGAAATKARDLMARLGVEAGGYEVTVSDETGVPGLVSVTGAQVVDGTQTGLAWSVQLAGTGVQSASAPLASLVELGTYDVVSADAAVERLNDPRFGASYGGMVPLAARAEDAVADDSVSMAAPAPADPTVPPVPSPGDPIAWPVQHVTITGARLGVTLLSTPDGASLLVPAWELTDADGSTWSVVAVVEDQLDLDAA